MLDCFPELTILKLCMCLYLVFRVILCSLKSQNILVAVMCIQLLHVLYVYLYSHSPHNVMHSYSNYYQLISATWRWFESPLTFSRCAQHNFPLVPANIRAECHYSSIHSHLHLHWWSCHCCLLDSKQSYSHWGQCSPHHFSDTERSSDSHLQAHSDGDWETGRILWV